MKNLYRIHKLLLMAVFLTAIILFPKNIDAASLSEHYGLSESNPFLNEKDVTDHLSNLMIEHKSDETFYYKNDSLANSIDSDWSKLNSFIQTICKKIYADHKLNEPVKGDYLKYTVLSILPADGSMVLDDSIIRFHLKINYYTSMEEEAYINQQIINIRNSLSLSSLGDDYQKIRKIYSYVCQNVRYQNYPSGNTDYTAYAAIKNKTATCQGYAALLYRLLLTSGFDSRIIEGNMDGERHTWNLVKYKEKWYPMDATWDRYDVSKGSYHYFMYCNNATYNDSFPDHIRSSEYATAAFYAAHPMGGHITTSTLKKATVNANGSLQSKCTLCGNITNNSIIYAISRMSLSTSSYVYDGKAKYPTVTILDSAGKIIPSNSYTLQYDSSESIGTHQVTATFTNHYSGSISGRFSILPKGTTIKNISGLSKGMKISWKKQAVQTNGYQIQYSLKSNFSAAKILTINKNSILTKKITKLKARKYYYVRIRTYKTVAGKKYYSTWSSKKKIKTK